MSWINTLLVNPLRAVGSIVDPNLLPYTDHNTSMTNTVAPGTPTSQVLAPNTPTSNLLAAPTYDTSGGSYYGSGSYSGSGTTSQPVTDPAVAAYIQSQIDATNNQIGSLDPTLQTGLQNILSSYNNAQNNENNSYGIATRDYNTQRTNTIQDLQQAKNNIATGVRQNTNALQRLLGLHGSGDSSASQILAPYAAHQQGSQQQQGVQQTYGRNLQAADTAYGDTTNKHQNNLTDLGTQKFQNEQGLRSGIANTKSSLLSQLSGLTGQLDQAKGKTLAQATADMNPYLTQINQITNSLPGLSSQYQNPINLANPSVYQAPGLGSYNYDITRAPQLPTGQMAADPNNVAPTFNAAPINVTDQALKRQPSALTAIPTS